MSSGRSASAFNSMTEELDVARGRLTDADRQLALRSREVAQEKMRSEELLENILPDAGSSELRPQKGAERSKEFRGCDDCVHGYSLGYADSTLRLSAEELVDNLHDYFTALDRIVSRYGLGRLEERSEILTRAGGLPVRNPAHPVEAVLTGFELLETVRLERLPGKLCPVGGAHRDSHRTGDCWSGGIRKFAFDVWGETVSSMRR